MKAQNTSHAVMAQRLEPPDSLDFFPTPPWATRGLIEHVLKPLSLAYPNERVCDPAAGKGHMVRPLAEFFSEVLASDIFDYGMGYEVFDFLSLENSLGMEAWPFDMPDWIIANPPFGPAANPRFTRFTEIAERLARIGVAMFGRIQALESEGRYKRIYRAFGGHVLWAQHVERVPLVEGRYDPKASSASAYGWLLVLNQKHGFMNTLPVPSIPTVFIPPCRKSLERQGDFRELTT